MTSSDTTVPQSPLWVKSIAILALVFGMLTLLSGGSVLFGPTEVQTAAGDYIPLVLWFNFLAGFLYITAAIGIWLRCNWATELSVFIAMATCLIALGFGYQVIRGDAYETRTVGALALRIGVWTAIAWVLMRARDQK